MDFWEQKKIFFNAIIRKMQTPQVNNSRIRKLKNVEFTVYCFYKEPSI